MTEAHDPALEQLSVTVRRSGGFAGVQRGWALSLADTDLATGARVRELAAQAAALQSPEQPGAAAADGFRYEVLLDSGGGASQLRHDGGPVLPAPMAELVEIVREHGSPAQ